MNGLAPLLGGILAALRTALTRCAAVTPARAALLYALSNRVSRLADRLDRLFARWQAGTLPSQTGASPRPSPAGRERPAASDSPRSPRLRFPTGRLWLFQFARLPAAVAQGHLQHWMTHPDLPEFLAAAPQAGRLLRPLCRLVGLEAQPGVPASLNLPNPPPFRPSPPPPAPTLGIIDPPEAPLVINRWHWQRPGYNPGYPKPRI